MFQRHHASSRVRVRFRRSGLSLYLFGKIDVVSHDLPCAIARNLRHTRTKGHKDKDDKKKIRATMTATRKGKTQKRKDGIFVS